MIDLYRTAAVFALPCVVLESGDHNGVCAGFGLPACSSDAHVVAQRRRALCHDRGTLATVVCAAGGER